MLIPLAEEIPDPASIKPGAWALVMFIFLLVAGFFLFRSLRKQLNRVDFPEDATPPRGESGGSAGS